MCVCLEREQVAIEIKRSLTQLMVGFCIAICMRCVSISQQWVCVMCVLLAHLLSTIWQNRNEADVKFETLLKTLRSNIICSIKLASVQYTCWVFFLLQFFLIRCSSFLLIPYKYLELTENTAQELQHVKLSASVQKDCNCDFVVFFFSIICLCVSLCLGTQWAKNLTICGWTS